MDFARNFGSEQRVVMSQGFTNPEIHGITEISAMTIDLERGACIYLSFVQDDAINPFGLPQVQIFGGPEMVDKFKQLAAEINAIFQAPPEGVSVEEWEGPKEPPTLEIPF
jgi:hypothetical protein